jgi:hypothetical protein
MPSLDTGSFMIVVDDLQLVRDFLEQIVGLDAPTRSPNDIFTYALAAGGKQMSVAQAAQVPSSIKHAIELRSSQFDSVLQKLRSTWTAEELTNSAITFGMDTTGNVTQIVMDLGVSRLRITRS